MLPQGNRSRCLITAGLSLTREDFVDLPMPYSFSPSYIMTVLSPLPLLLNRCWRPWLRLVSFFFLFPFGLAVPYFRGYLRVYSYPLGHPSSGVMRELKEVLVLLYQSQGCFHSPLQPPRPRLATCFRCYRVMRPCKNFLLILLHILIYARRRRREGVFFLQFWWLYQ